MLIVSDRSPEQDRRWGSSLGTAWVVACVLACVRMDTFTHIYI